MSIDPAPDATGTLPHRDDTHAAVSRQPQLRRTGTGPAQLSRALGVLSLSLGIPALVTPESLTRAVGLAGTPTQQTVTRIVGAREILHAAGLLVAPRRPEWPWSRVAGDIIDLSALGLALSHAGRSGRRRRAAPGRTRTVAALTTVAGITALDIFTAIAVTRSRTRERTVELTATTTIRKDPSEVYAYWRNFENLGSFMAHVECVTTNGDNRTHWRVSAPFGTTVEWDAEIVTERPGETLAWRAVEGADVNNEGRVTFARAPGDRGTEVHVQMRYEVPGGKAGELAARFLGEDPHQQLDDDLRRLKQVMETGEIVRSEGAPEGKRARHEFPQHPARPLSADELKAVSK